MSKSERDRTVGISSPQLETVFSCMRDWQFCCVQLSFGCLLQLYPRDLACIATMLTFEYISQLCQNKEWVCPPSDTKATEGEPIYVLAGLREQKEG